MIKSVEVVNFLGGVENESKVIELGAPETSGLWVKSIKGIGPGKAAINTTDLASSDGGIFNSARAEVRNITITLGFVEYTNKQGKIVSIEETRRETYKWFGKKKQLKIIFHTDQIHLYTYGYVESNEPDIFNKQETTSISIICPDPNFYDYNGESEISFSSLTDLFEFPMYDEHPENDGYQNLSVDQANPEWFETSDTKFLAGKEYYERVEVIADPNNYYLYTLTNDIEMNPYFITQDESFQIEKTYYERTIYENGHWIYKITTDDTMNPNKNYYERNDKTYYEYYDRTEFASLSEIGEEDIYYRGEVEIGVEITAIFSDSVTGFKIFKINEELGTSEILNLDDVRLTSVVGSGFVTGDILTICTINGKKSAYLNRNNTFYNVMNALGTNPDWFQLTEGANTFSYSADTGSENVSLYIRYQQAYEGL